MDSAVIFDVDGVLLELTSAEEDAFFLAFDRLYGLRGLSRDWNSYRIRNDRHIISEILERHGLPLQDAREVERLYLEILSSGLEKNLIRSVPVPGSAGLLRALMNRSLTGIATANLLEAARIRLDRHDLWKHVSALAFGAESGSHKRDTVACAIAASGLPKARTVYIGDNLNDVDAGLSNGIPFIGFSTDAERREQLRRAGAAHISADHRTTLRLIENLLL